MLMNLAGHLELLGRFDRGLALKEIIFSTVKEGDIVVDAGCGTGLLSIWAAQAGAARVFAVDSGDLTVGKILAEENGFADVISFVNKDLNEFELPNGTCCDVLLAMVYFNDPRRDFAQTRLCADLRERLLKTGGVHVPDRIQYTVCPLDWPAQDVQTKFSDINKKVGTIEGRYGISLKGLLDRSKQLPDRTWFPVRQASGILHRHDAKALSGKHVLFCEVDYSERFEGYPDHIDCEISQAGVCNSLVFTQSLIYEDRLIFANESLSWVLNPMAVVADESVRFSIEKSWLQTSYVTVSALGA